jgi:hypothetical protein
MPRLPMMATPSSGLVYAYKRPGLPKPIETVVSSSIAYGKDPASELLMVAVEWTRFKGTEPVVLHTRVDRDDAHAFFQRVGYANIATSHVMTKPMGCRWRLSLCTVPASPRWWTALRRSTEPGNPR